MKRLAYIFASIALVCSCSHLESGTETVEAGYTTFFVSLENDPASRVSIESDASVKWSYGDSIAVFSDELPAPVIFKKNATEAKFTGSPVNGTVFCGYFPPEKDAFTKEAPHQLSFDSPAPVFNGNSSRAPMVAVSDDNHLFFRQTCGMLHFFIQSDTDYDLFAFFGNNEEMIAGRGTVNLDDELPEFSLLPEGRNIISSFIPGNVSFVNGFHLYILLPPMRLEKGFTLVFYKMNEDGSDVDAVCPVTSEKALQIERGQSVRMKDIKLGTDQPKPRLDIVKPDYMYRTGPHADLIDLTKLGISGTFNGIPLNIRYSTTNSWITLLGEGQAALIQGNTFTYPRTGNIRIQYCFGQIPIHQEFYNISQSSFNYKLEFTPNQEDFPYWRNFDTGGEKVLFFTPYEDTHSVVLRMSDPGLRYLLQPQTDIYTAGEDYIYANDVEYPAINFVDIENSGTGYDLNYKVIYSYSANRNYATEQITYDNDEDTVYRGLFRLCRVIFYPRIQCFDPDTWSTYEDYQYDADGNPVYSEMYLLQTPIIMDNDVWWHTCWPISDEVPDYLGFNPMLVRGDDEYGSATHGDIIMSNMNWNISDIVTDNPSWKSYFVLVEKSGSPTGGNVFGTVIYPYASPLAEYSNSFRPSSGYSERRAGIYVEIDMKDGKDPILWPIGNVYQPGIPVLRFVKFTWDGSWQSIHETEGGYTYNYATKGYFYLSMSGVCNYEFQRRGTRKHNGSFSWNDWTVLHNFDMSYTAWFKSTDPEMEGYQDCRIKYPNNAYVYAANGPWYYNTVGAPIEPNPIPASAEPAKRPDKSRRKTLEESLPKGLPALSKPVLTNGTPIK